MRTSLLQRIFDLIAPRTCCICGMRLAPEEQFICLPCNLHLPRTDHLDNPLDNEMAKMFWGRTEHVDRAAALRYFQRGSEVAAPIYDLKYHHRPEIGTAIGRLMAMEMQEKGFLEGTDFIIPVPLAQSRQADRGYNQSEIIARGMSEVCRLPVVTNVLRRREFKGSQTTRGRWERNANVEHAFSLHHGEKMKHSHILLIDDIVTTGATLCACARQLEKIEGITISMSSFGFVDTRL